MHTFFSLKRHHLAVAQLALFVMFLQALAPLSVALAVPSDQDPTTFYQVICSSHVTQDKQGPDTPSSILGDKCTACSVCSLAGQTPNTPTVAFTPLPRSRERAVPPVTILHLGLWTNGPAQARAPPLA